MAPVPTDRLLGTAALAAAGLGAYALAEARAYRLQRHRLPHERPGRPVSILHISDTHLLAGNRKLIRFLERLPDLVGEVPDLVIATGDLIEDDSGIDPLVETFGRIEASGGRFYVLGSHDYYRSSLRGAGGTVKALLGMERQKVLAKRNDAGRLEEGLRDKGWVPLTNRSEIARLGDLTVRLTGTDDPYINRHTTEHFDRSDDDLAIGVIHAPDLVSQFVLRGYDLVLAGHTHAGQVRAPFIGALLTNCTLPRELAGGPRRIGDGWLHVSPGLGTGRYSPIRFLARPEATLLRLG